MSISASTGGGNSTLTLVRVTPTAKATAILSALAEVLYERRESYYPLTNGIPILPASLTNQQKLDLLEAYWIAELKTLSRIGYVDKEVKTARATATTAANTDLDL